MVTTLIVPRLWERATGVLSRSGSVTLRDFAAVRRRGFWLVVISGFFEPVLYLLSIGIGVGSLVGNFRLADGTTVTYAAFVAPAMLAASAMNAAVAESTANFYGKLKWAKLYDGMVATPLRPLEIAVGELSWALIRSTLYSCSFLAIMVAMNLTTMARVVPALIATLLVGFAFGSVGMAVSTIMRGWNDFDYVNVAVFAMFLFSGTFAPVDAYPPGLRYVLVSTPLYQGVALLRGLTAGGMSWGLLGHVLYLVVMAALGLAVASRRMSKLLCA